MSTKKTLSVILIIAGIILPVCTLLLSSEYYTKDSFFWNIIRNVVTGEIIVRDSVFEVVPDRDEDLYREFNEYKTNNPEYENLPEVKLIEKFYQEHYRNKMHGVEFRLKLQKEKIVTHQSKIVIPYRYIFIFSVVLIFTGAGIIMLLKIKDKKKYKKERNKERNIFYK
jgi:hypothetical protein